MKKITIFGSSLPCEGAEAYEEARRLGRLLARAGFTVCNGGYSGLMEASARGARDAGGHTIGVTCAVWPSMANRWIVQELRAQSFLERLVSLMEIGDAYIVLPGGTGTLAELALGWELMNKARLSKTVGGRKPLLVTVPYWQLVIDCLKQEAKLASNNGGTKPLAANFVTPVSSVEQSVEFLRNWVKDRT